MSFAELLRALAHGAGYTVAVTLACAATGFVTGLLITGLRRVPLPALQSVLALWVFVLRGVPVLVLLFLVYFGLPSIGVKVSPWLAMMLSLGLVAGAYLSEVFRGALAAVDTAEVDAALAMGFSRRQVFFSIELPQMLRFAVPGMVNEFTTVLKYSPFAYTVGLPEVTKEAMTLTATTLRGMEIYLAAGCLYFVIYRVLLIAVHAVERYFRVPGMEPT